MFVLKEMVVESINCAYCNVKIPRPQKTQKYCGIPCRTKASNARQKVEMQKKEKVMHEVICPYCENIIMTTNRRQKYCNPKCKKLYNLQITKEKRRKIMEEKEKSHKIDPYFITGKKS